MALVEKEEREERARARETTRFDMGGHTKDFNRGFDDDEEVIDQDSDLYFKKIENVKPYFEYENIVDKGTCVYKIKEGVNLF
jgi:hypothetical protein